MKNNNIKNLTLFGIGSGVSQFGTHIYAFAIGLYVLKVTGSGISFAITLALGLLPIILVSPFAGVLSDYFNKKRITVLMDLLNGLLFIGLFFYMTFSELTLPVIYLTSFLSNVFFIFFHIAIEAAKPQLVDDHLLSRINSVSQILMAGSSILSPMLGGFIYAFVDIRMFIAINGISFLISAVSETFMDFSYNRIRKTEPDQIKPVFQSLKEGWHYVINKSVLFKLLGFFVVLNFLFSFSAILPLPYILNNHIGLSEGNYGITQSMMPLGMIIGAICVEMVTKRLGFNKTLYRTLIYSFIFMGLLGLPLVFPALTQTTIATVVYFSLTLLGLGITISLIDVPIFTILQGSTDEAYRGRVISLTVALVKIINPIAYLLSGYFISNINPYILPLAGSIIAIIYVLLSKNAIMSLEETPSDNMVTDSAA